jgi:hypothetical protein
MYRRQVHVRVFGKAVLRFLLQDEVFPRAWRLPDVLQHPARVTAGPYTAAQVDLPAPLAQAYSTD